CALLFFWFGRVAPHAAVRRAHAPIRELRPVARSLVMIYFTVVCRSAVSVGFATFLPLWVHAHGGSVTRGGWITTIYPPLAPSRPAGWAASGGAGSPPASAAGAWW